MCGWQNVFFNFLSVASISKYQVSKAVCGILKLKGIGGIWANHGQVLDHDNIDHGQILDVTTDHGQMLYHVTTDHGQNMDHVYASHVQSLYNV